VECGESTHAHPIHNLTKNIICIGMSNYTRVQHVWNFTITNKKIQKPSRTQQDQFRTWATPLTRTQQSQIDAQLGLATTPAPSAFLLSDAWHRADIEYLSPTAPVRVRVRVTLQLTVSQSVSMSWCRAQSGTCDQRYFFF
jgi:hypothetical protein